MNKYVLGFIFDEYAQNRILLIKKNRGPNDIKGKWNALGGKIEEGETPLQAIGREINEEAGIDIENWVNFGKLITGGGEIELFYALTELVYEGRTKTDEIVRMFNLSEFELTMSDYRWPEEIYECDDLWYGREKYVKNLDYLIPMALNHHTGADRTKYFEIKENY